MDSVYLINFMLKLQSQVDLLVECLVCLFEIFLNDCLLILELNMLLFQMFQLLVSLCPVHLLRLVEIIQQLILTVHLFLQLVELKHFLSLDLSNHRLKTPLSTIFDQKRVNPPNAFSNKRVLRNIFEESVEPNRVNK